MLHTMHVNASSLGSISVFSYFMMTLVSLVPRPLSDFIL